MTVERSRVVLPAIVLSQFAGTSTWFGANAVLADLGDELALPPDAVADLTSAVQLGFISGTLAFAFFAVSDRCSPRRVFLVCALCGALANLGLLAAESLPGLSASRFLTGFFLAGIYPVGMKIAAGWYREDLGKAIGLLVAALVAGTAFPHLIRAAGAELPWQAVVVAVSATAALGGVVMASLVPDGPYLGASAHFDPRALVSIFRSPRFRASAFGYFGHMWELYAFWAFLPLLLAAFVERSAASLDVSLWAFLVIAAGSVGCAAGGLLATRLGSARVASAQLTVSGLCCVLSPVAFHAPAPVFLGFLLLWGITVIGDSPQLSTLNARHAPAGRVGSALTIANCIGFTVTIASIQLLGHLSRSVPAELLLLPLVLGPVFGLVSMRRLAASPHGEPAHAEPLRA